MVRRFHKSSLVIVAVCLLGAAVAFADGWKSNTASNILDSEAVGGIANSRHNLTMSYLGEVSPMDDYRNNYYEVCVYCHTPHGANRTMAGPLWNRTVTQRTYGIYSGTTSMLNQEVSQPGPNSLTCLSCHDGATAIDSIINMPTTQRPVGGGPEHRAGYLADQETTMNFNSFLDRWGETENNAADGLSATFVGHAALNIPPPNFQDSNTESACFACHDPGGATFPTFTVFAIGGNMTRSVTYGADVTDKAIDTLGAPVVSADSGFLADDHPIGVRYPTRFDDDRGVDYNEPTVMKGRVAFFDRDNDGQMDANEVRLYNTGDGYEVECASCHDPHGVPVAEGGIFAPSFLRIGRNVTDVIGTTVSANAGSELCLTCHVK